jgi:hypothetical protein
MVSHAKTQQLSWGMIVAGFWGPLTESSDCLIVAELQNNGVTIVPYNSCWITGHTTNSSDYSIVVDFRIMACNWVTIVPHNSHWVLESCLTIQRLFDSGSIAEQQHIIKRLLWGTILTGIWGDGLNPATIVGYDSYRNMGWWLEFLRLLWGMIVAGFWHGTLISSDYRWVR